MPRHRKYATDADRRRARAEQQRFRRHAETPHEAETVKQKPEMRNGFTERKPLGPWGPLSPQQMQAERVARGEPLVRDPADPSGIGSWRAWKAGLTGSSLVTVPGGTDRMGLRASLKALEEAYGRAQDIHDWKRCSEINVQREPLFAALWELEKELPKREQYWFPARYSESRPDIQVLR